jgi:hypothetical protein
MVPIIAARYDGSYRQNSGPLSHRDSGREREMPHIPMIEHGYHAVDDTKARSGKSVSQGF